MRSAKDIFIKPINARTANALIKKVHYSGKVVQNSQLHFGVFLDGKLEGALQFGHSLDKRKMLNTVKGTLWNEFIELNRMAFGDNLPKLSESRAIGVTLRLIKKKPIVPSIKEINENPPSRSAKLRYAIKQESFYDFKTDILEKFDYLLEIENLSKKI